MDAIDAIRTRRMQPRVTDEAPSREDVAELLELATRAPNHFRTEPWRFLVLKGEGKDPLARAIADEAVAGRGKTPEEAAEAARTAVARAPVIVVFTCVPSDDPKVIEQEEIASVAMAIENFLLAAHAKGLGAMLRTGGAAYDAAARRHLDLAPNEKVVGFVYLGPPAADRALTERAPAGTKTRWVGWD